MFNIVLGARRYIRSHGRGSADNTALASCPSPQSAVPEPHRQKRWYMEPQVSTRSELVGLACEELDLSVSVLQKLSLK